MRFCGTEHSHYCKIQLFSMSRARSMHAEKPDVEVLNAERLDGSIMCRWLYAHWELKSGRKKPTAEHSVSIF